MNASTRPAPATRGFEVLQIVGELRLAGVADRPRAGEAGRLRAGMRAVAVEGRERCRLARDPMAGLRRDRLDAAEPLGDVVLEADLGELAVADHVDAELALAAHDRRRTASRSSAGERLRVVGLPGHPREQLGGERFRPWEAAHVGGDDAALPFVDQCHGSGPGAAEWLAGRDCTRAARAQSPSASRGGAAGAAATDLAPGGAKGR